MRLFREGIALNNTITMKKSLTSLFAFAVFVQGALAVDYTIYGTTDSASPAVFTNSANWSGGTLPTFDKTAAIYLGQTSTTATSTYYYNIDGSITVNKIYASTDANYVLRNNSSTDVLTLDVNDNSASLSSSNSVITFSTPTSTTANVNFTIATGTYNITSTGSAATPRAFFGMPSANSAISGRQFTIASDATVNSFVNLYFCGGASTYSNGFVIDGTVNAYNGTTDTWGSTELYWNTAAVVYGTGAAGGLRTKVVVSSTGALNTGNLTLNRYARMEVAGNVNVHNNLVFYVNTENPGAVFNVNSGGTATVAGDIGNYTASTGVFQINIAGEFTAAGTLTLNTNTGSIPNDIGSGTVWLAGGSQFNVTSGGTANLGAVAMTGGTVSSAGTLIVGTGTVAGGTVAVNSGGTANFTSITQTAGTIAVNSGGTADLGALSMGGGTMTVGGTASTVLSYTSGTMTVSNGGTLTLKSGSTASIASGLTVNGTLTIASGADITLTAAPVISTTTSSLNVAGKLTSNALLSVRNFNLTGEFTQTAAGYFTVAGGTIGTGGKLVMHGGLYLNGGTFTVESGANTLNLGTTAENPRVIISGVNLVLNKEDAFTSSSGTWVGLVGIATTSANLYINSSQHFTTIYLPENNVSVKFILSANSNDKLFFTGSLNFSAGSLLTIQNFEDQRIYIANIGSLDVATRIIATDALGNNLGPVEWREDGWLYLAVPEPATYAAILGGIALLAAIRRRRK